MQFRAVLKRGIQLFALLTITTTSDYPFMAQQAPDGTQQPPSTTQPASIKHFNLNDYAHVGGSVAAPEAISTTQPELSSEAKAEVNKKTAKKEATAYLLIGINDHGTVDFVKIVRPVGMGLDQKAAEAVGQWRFKLAMKKGQPIACQTYVEINFRLY